MEEGALLEPLSVGVHACRRAGVGLGSEVLILGAGPIGLVTLVTAKAMGASKIMITDLFDQRLVVAKGLGANFVLRIDKNMAEADVVANVHKQFGSAPDKTIDCSGAEATNRLAIFATRSGGCAVFVGMGPEEVKLPLANALAREVDIRGVFRYANE
jgi:L-iditol 2-dehydrogenase